MVNRSPRVLVVEDEHDIAGLIKHALERAGDGQVAHRVERRRRAPRDHRAAARCHHSRPEPAGPERDRGLPHRPQPARHRQHPDHHADGADRPRPIASPGSTSAPTTTSPSRSACASSPRACARCFAARADRRASGAAMFKGVHLTADFDAVAIAVDGDGRPPHPARVRAAAIPGREPQPGHLARSAARARLGLRPLHRDALGRRARRPAARQARHAPASRSKRSSASAIASSSS